RCRGSCSPRGAADGYPWFRLPALPRFLPARRRPGIAALETRGRAWLAHHLREAYDSPQLLDEFLDHRTTLWNLLVYATARDDRIDLICRWIDVLFSVDDVFVHASPQRLQRLGVPALARVLAGEKVPAETTYTRVFGQLRERTRAVMPDALWERYRHSLEGFLDACRTERGLARDADTLDLATYEKYRNLSIGECCYPLAEFGLGIDLTVALRDHPELSGLAPLVSRHWIGVNDIFSYRKELYSGDTMNEVRLALADNGGDLQAAVDRIAATITRVEDEFDSLRARLRGGPAGQDPAVLRYLDALEWMIAGNLEWSYLTPRYNGRGHIWDGRTRATVILTPGRTLYLPASEEWPRPGPC
ncbi:terpene synthase family protein, partial [Streptomyces sp. URMC 123]|uniref:terpene synthase family protein n=1 Tax=Streptomyces sp. URMC 123 TaxID=3423403 RepID=UPI003F1AA763